MENFIQEIVILLIGYILGNAPLKNYMDDKKKMKMIKNSLPNQLVLANREIEGLASNKLGTFTTEDIKDIIYHDYYQMDVSDKQVYKVLKSLRKKSRVIMVDDNDDIRFVTWKSKRANIYYKSHKTNKVVLKETIEYERGMQTHGRKEY